MSDSKYSMDKLLSSHSNEDVPDLIDVNDDVPDLIDVNDDDLAKAIALSLGEMESNLSFVSTTSTGTNPEDTAFDDKARAEVETKSKLENTAKIASLQAQVTQHPHYRNLTFSTIFDFVDAREDSPQAPYATQLPSKDLDWQKLDFVLRPDEKNADRYVLTRFYFKCKYQPSLVSGQGLGFNFEYAWQDTVFKPTDKGLTVYKEELGKNINTSRDGNNAVQAETQWVEVHSVPTLEQLIKDKTKPIAYEDIPQYDVAVTFTTLIKTNQTLSDHMAALPKHIRENDGRIRVHQNYHEVSDEALIQYKEILNKENPDVPYLSHPTCNIVDQWKGLPFILRPDAERSGYYKLTFFYFVYTMNRSLARPLQMQNKLVYQVEYKNLIFKPVAEGFLTFQEKAEDSTFTADELLGSLVDLFSTMNQEEWEAELGESVVSFYDLMNQKCSLVQYAENAQMLDSDKSSSLEKNERSIRKHLRYYPTSDQEILKHIVWLEKYQAGPYVCTIPRDPNANQHVFVLRPSPIQECHILSFILYEFLKPQKEDKENTFQFSARNIDILIMPLVNGFQACDITGIELDKPGEFPPTKDYRSLEELITAEMRHKNLLKHRKNPNASIVMHRTLIDTHQTLIQFAEANISGMEIFRRQEVLDEAYRAEQSKAAEMKRKDEVDKRLAMRPSQSSSTNDENDAEFARAIQLSLQSQGGFQDSSEDEELKRALEASLREVPLNYVNMDGADVKSHLDRSQREDRGLISENNPLGNEKASSRSGASSQSTEVSVDVKSTAEDNVQTNQAGSVNTSTATNVEPLVWQYSTAEYGGNLPYTSPVAQNNTASDESALAQNNASPAVKANESSKI